MKESTKVKIVKEVTTDMLFKDGRARTIIPKGAVGIVTEVDNVVDMVLVSVDGEEDCTWWIKMEWLAKIS